MARYRDRLLASAQVETRVIGGVPWRPWDSWQWRFDTGGPPHPSRQFLGADAALGLPALYSGVKLMSESAASMNVNTYLLQPGKPKRLWTGPSFFDDPSYNLTLHEWIKSLMVSVMLQGNAWGWITSRDNYGYPQGIEWIPPQDVYVMEPESEQSWNPLEARVFVFGREARWHGPDAELYHIRGLPMPGRLEGISPLRQFALTILAGTEAQRYGTDWYASGGFPPGTFQNAEIEVDRQQAAEMRAELVRSLRRREPLVYGRDWDYKPVTVPPSEAQFIDAMQLNATQIAAILNLPPDRIGGTRGDSLTYSTVEQGVLQILEALRPWCVNMQQSFSKFLLPRNRTAKFNVMDLMQMDGAARMQMYQIMRNIGLRTVNELREMEDLAPIAGIGDETLPLTTMNAMGTRAGVIPKSFMKSVVLEMDVATDRLIKLEKYLIPELVKQGYPVQGTAPAPGMGGGGFGGDTNTAPSASPNPNPNGSGIGANGAPSLYPVTVNGKTGTPIGKPNAPLPLTQDPASFLASLISVQRNADLPHEVRIAAQDMLISIAERADRIQHEEPDIDVPEHHMYAPLIPGRADVRDMVYSTNGKNRGHL